MSCNHGQKGFDLDCDSCAHSFSTPTLHTRITKKNVLRLIGEKLNLTKIIKVMNSKFVSIKKLLIMAQWYITYVYGGNLNLDMK